MAGILIGFPEGALASSGLVRVGIAGKDGKGACPDRCSELSWHGFGVGSGLAAVTFSGVPARLC